MNKMLILAGALLMTAPAFAQNAADSQSTPNNTVGQTRPPDPQDKSVPTEQKLKEKDTSLNQGTGSVAGPQGSRIPAKRDAEK